MDTIAPADRILCAIDTADLDGALALSDALGAHVGGVKLGMTFFTANGPAGLSRLAEAGRRIFLDLKYHDIPNTVGEAVAAASGLGCFMLTVHASGDAAMVRAAVSAADAAVEAGGRRPLIVAVTVLTSIGETELAEIGQTGPVAAQVSRLGRLARDSGADGLVASPLEVAALRAELGPECKLVVPGVRPAWAGHDDQRRVMTPADAVRAGADYLVIGRPITRADDPAAAARRIADEIAAI